MTLLQISDPTENKKIALGIDFGTTNTLIATINPNDQQPYIITVNEKELIPTIIQYTQNQIKIGNEIDLNLANPNNTIRSIKRLVGKSLSESKKINQSNQIEINKNKNITLSINNTHKTPIEIIADILKYLYQQALKELNQIDGTVITVPAYFDETQKKTIRDAAKIASIPLLRIINEPTAAAIAYGLDKKNSSNIMIYDLGGGTFDVSVLNINEGIFEVLATGGDNLLGGDDIDEKTTQWLIKKLAIKQISSSDKIKLQKIATEAKIKLSQTNQSEIKIHWGNQTTILDKKTYQENISEIIHKTIKICKQTLLDSNLNIKELDEIVLVGGSTKDPIIMKTLQQHFKVTIKNQINPDTIVALGAAIQANKLLGNREEDLLLLDVIPLSLGIETMGGLTEKIIPRNTTIPITRAQEFTTHIDGQTAMKIHIVQGERELSKDNRSLAIFTITDIPPMKAGIAKIRISFHLNNEGLLTVTAQELTNNQESKIEIDPSYGLNEEQIYNIINQSINESEQDINNRLLIEAKNAAQELINMIQTALKEDHELLTKEEIKEIKELIQNLNISLQKENRQIIKQQQQQLTNKTEQFASKRMDKAMNKLLTGKTIGDL